MNEWEDPKLTGRGKEPAHATLVRPDLRGVADAIRLGRRTLRTIRWNLFWAFFYNVIAIPAAAGVLQPWGIILRPEWGALIMSASTVIVAFNALLLRRVRLDR